MKNITVILPIHKLDDDYKLMLVKALESIEDFHNDVKVSIVCPTKIEKEFKKLSEKLEIKIIPNKGKTDFKNANLYKYIYLKKINKNK